VVNNVSSSAVEIATNTAVENGVISGANAQTILDANSLRNSLSIGGGKKDKGGDSDKKTAVEKEKTRVYDDSTYDKHANKSVANVSKRPEDGQAALDNSVLVKNKANGERRIGVDKKNSEVVVLDEHRFDPNTNTGTYHGHVPKKLENTDLKNAAKTHPNIRVKNDGTPIVVEDKEE
jgi:hypothetical protein